MDVTYAVVNKGRRGGGAAGRGHAPSGPGTAPPPRDHAPPGTAPLPGSPVRRPSPPPAASPQGADVTYEVVTPQGDAGGPSHLGFNFRIGKPKGPREPPPDWSRV